MFSIAHFKTLESCVTSRFDPSLLHPQLTLDHAPIATVVYMSYSKRYYDLWSEKIHFVLLSAMSEHVSEQKLCALSKWQIKTI